MESQMRSYMGSIELMRTWTKSAMRTIKKCVSHYIHKKKDSEYIFKISTREGLTETRLKLLFDEADTTIR